MRDSGDRTRFGSGNCGAVMPLRAIAALLVVLAALPAPPAVGQVPLSAVNDETTVRAISFRFVNGSTLEPTALEEQIWHRDPGFWDKVLNFLPFFTAPQFPFSPIELQRDVLRLEQFYERNGFLHPIIDYPASQVDTSSNTIHIIFTIREGPPLIIQDVGFFADDDTYVAETFDGPLRERWIDYRDEVTLEAGNRYTEFEGIRLQDQVLTWLKNAGFAFAGVSRQARVDSSANTVDLRFGIDPGPRAYVSEIQIEGNESVSDEVVLRELPFEVGDRFNAEELSQGQRELFELNLFRVAIAEVPEQPEDSTVIVRYRLQEAEPRHVTAQTGYALDQGALLQGSWTHRNFLGGARLFTATATYSSGYGAARIGGFDAAQEKSASLLLRQPYLFTRKLSGSISPAYTRGQNDRFGIHYEEFEANTTLLYTIYNFRTVSFHHSISRANPLGDAQSLAPIDSLSQDERENIDIFTQNAFSLTASLGNVDDYFRPTAGFRIRPHLEVGGVVVQLPDDVDYYKAQTEALGYLPVGGGYSLTGRFFVGNIWPQGESRNQADPQIEYRFDRIRYYAGGASDVRGWAADFLGPKIASRRISERDDGTIDTTYSLEPLGGLAKIAANIELRTPMPLLGPSWKAAVFLDMGQVFPSDFRDQTEPFRLRDVTATDLRFSTGAGVRYETLVGFIRFDLGYKINPALDDLATDEEVYKYQQYLRGLGPEPEIDTPLLDRDRFRFHLSIGQTF